MRSVKDTSHKWFLNHFAKLLKKMYLENTLFFDKFPDFVINFQKINA